MTKIKSYPRSYTCRQSAAFDRDFAVLLQRNFKIYLSDQQRYLSARYTFLPPDQIRGKVKENWEKLSLFEKQSYVDIARPATPSRSKEYHRSISKSPSNPFPLMDDAELVTETRDHENAATEADSMHSDSLCVHGKKDFTLAEPIRTYADYHTIADWMSSCKKPPIIIHENPAFQTNSILSVRSPGGAGAKKSVSFHKKMEDVQLYRESPGQESKIIDELPAHSMGPQVTHRAKRFCQPFVNKQPLKNLPEWSNRGVEKEPTHSHYSDDSNEVSIDSPTLDHDNKNSSNDEDQTDAGSAENIEIELDIDESCELTKANVEMFDKISRRKSAGEVNGNDFWGDEFSEWLPAFPNVPLPDLSPKATEHLESLEIESDFMLNSDEESNDSVQSTQVSTTCTRTRNFFSQNAAIVTVEDKDAEEYFSSSTSSASQGSATANLSPETSVTSNDDGNPASHRAKENDNDVDRSILDPLFSQSAGRQIVSYQTEENEFETFLDESDIFYTSF